MVAPLVFHLALVLHSSASPTDDFIGDVLCERAIRILGTLHPSHLISDESNRRVKNNLQKARDLIASFSFSQVGQIDTQLLDHIHNLDPHFSDFWKEFHVGYERMPPHLKQEILLQYIEFREAGDTHLQESLNQAIGMAQVMTLRPQDYQFSYAWGLHEYFRWHQAHPVGSDVLDHNIILDSSLYATGGPVHSKINWYQNLRRSLAEGLGLNDVGLISMTPTIISEQGMGAMPSVRRHMGPWKLASRFEKPLSPSELSFTERAAHLFESLKVGKSPSTQPDGNVINDDWIVAESFLTQGTLFTLDRHLARPFEDFVGIDLNTHVHTKPNRSRTEVFGQWDLEMKVEINEWRSFNSLFRSTPVPIFELTLKDIRTDQAYSLQFVRLRMAPVVPPAHSSSTTIRLP